MARVSFKYNVFKNQGYKNRERNCSAPIRFLEKSDGTLFLGTFEHYMDLVDANPNIFNFPPLVFETTGFFASDSYQKVCESLACRKCEGLNEFLDGRPVILRKNVFAIQSYGSLFPDKESAKRCIARMMKPGSPYFQIEPLFDGLFPQEAQILEDSVKVLNFTRDKRPGDDLVHFLVRFDMEVRLTDVFDPLDKSLLKEPFCMENDRKFYNLARTLNDNLDHFYFVEHLNAVMFKNETEEESDRTFCLEFQHYLAKYSVGEYVKILYPLINSSDWRKKLEFWNAPEKFDFKKPVYSFVHLGTSHYSYEVPNRTCQNVLNLLIRWYMDENLMKNLKKFCELIEKKTMQMIFSRMPYSIQVEQTSFSAHIRDVRTIQDLEVHCHHVFDAMKNLHDYFEQEVIAKEETFFEHVSRLVLEQVKLNPLDYMESENPFIKKLATACVNGSYYGE
ncbi:hypothetical protein BGX12_10781 [Fibrobacter sp. UWR4]|uniref:hypothetical protein n=2 Tax=unclassified Fibrobacter TaxID=2634177 RepID=UPI000D6CFE2D|nr:hypothetical protein [Fibrobacter sp. UWR4]PWJ68555.1 hypothetical protein BGX12_10781 [Fibrobacter sp. UWR4]PZW72053.1 hypothetical protein C8E88_100825 [Fibrobacter sp. UWR1]